MERIAIPFQSGQIAVPDAGALGIFRAQSDVNYRFYPTDRVVACQSFKPEYDRLQQLGFVTEPEVTGPFSQSLVHVTRSKVETLGLVAEALMQTDVGGLVLVDGAKFDGIDSVLKRCKSVMPIAGLISKAHGKLFWIERPSTLPPVLEDWVGCLLASRKDHGFLTAPGMFSADKIDVGSALLADHMNGLKGRVADLGAGWGWLSAQALEHESIKEIALFEAEQTALDAARGNITDPRASFHWVDVIEMQPLAEYDAVICNPPFHQGRAAEPDIGIGFIIKAAEMLKPKGVLWLVANRQLPYEGTLNEQFAHVSFVQESAQFKVISASRPRHHRKRR